MPIYEYLCEGCGKVNERLQKVNDPPPRTCDECGGRKLAKLVSRSAFQLKGGGWYSDLYSSAKKDAPKAEGGPATPAASAAPAASDSGGAKAETAKPAPAPAKASSERARKPGKAGKSG